MSIVSTFAKHFREAKAELEGKAISKARRIRPLAEIRSGEREDIGPPTATNIMVRMGDGRPMRYHTDGSLRHALGGVKPSRKALKAAKKARARHAA